MTVRLRRPIAGDIATRRFLATSACGVCGKAALDELEVRCAPVERRSARRRVGRAFAARPLGRAPAAVRPDRRAARGGAVRDRRAISSTCAKTSAGTTPSTSWSVRALLERSLPLANEVLLVSGRLSFELVQKAAVAGIPVLCAVSAPSSLAVAAAERFGQTVDRVPPRRTLQRVHASRAHRHRGLKPTHGSAEEAPERGSRPQSETPAARPVGRVEAERRGRAEAAPLPRHRQGHVGEPAQPPVGVAHPVEGRVRRVRARRRRFPRLDDQRRAPLHDAPRAAEGEHRARDPRARRSPTSKPWLRSKGRELRELGRLAHPMVRRRGDRGFRRVSWDDALDLVAGRIRRAGPERLGIYLTARGITNEVYYAAQKAARFIGTNNVDNAARVCHAPSTNALKETARRRRDHLQLPRRHRERSHRALRCRRRQRAAGLHEVPVPREEAGRARSRS